LKNYYVVGLCEKNRNCVNREESVNPQNSFSLLLTVMKAILKDAREVQLRPQVLPGHNIVIALRYFRQRNFYHSCHFV